MSTEYTFPKDDEEMVFYLTPEIGMRKDHNKSDANFYVRRILEKMITEYNIQPNQSIGFVAADQATFIYILVDLIEGYKRYWGNDIDFENDLDFSAPNKV